MAVRRIVIAGCGSIGQRHARLLSQRPDIMVELCDSNEGSLAETTRVIGDRPCHHDFDAMLATQPDILVIATPHTLHADQAIAAMRAGTHVLCEKPMSATLADAERMLESASKCSVTLDIGFTLHFHPALRRLKDLIASGALGSLVHVSCRVGTYATLAASRSMYQATLEGSLLLDYVHQPDLLYWLCGEAPAGVYMAGSVAGDLPLRSNPNVAELMLDYASGMLASIHLNYVQAPQRHAYEVVGDKAYATLDMESNTLCLGYREGNHETTEIFTVDRDNLFEQEHAAFLDAVAGRREPESPPGRAIVSMQVVDAALRSWKARERVAMKPI